MCSVTSRCQCSGGPGAAQQEGPFRHDKLHALSYLIVCDEIHEFEKLTQLARIHSIHLPNVIDRQPCWACIVEYLDSEPYFERAHTRREMILPKGSLVCRM
jgi:hypothetical protein